MPAPIEITRLGGGAHRSQRGQLKGLRLVTVGDGIPLAGFGDPGNINESESAIRQPAVGLRAR